MDFAVFLGLNHDWIKAADPGAVVLPPSLLGTYGYPMTNSFSWLRTILDLGGANHFDVMPYHDYNSWWTLPAHYDQLRNLLADEYRVYKPIWVTECSISSEATNRSAITPEYSSPEEQAADTWRRTCLLFGKGVDLVNWHCFWSSGGESEWRNFGLLDPRGHKKKSYLSFQLLVDKIEGFDQAQLLAQGDGADNNTHGGAGAWCVQFAWTNGVTRWVVWSPDRQPYTLTGLGAASGVSLIEVVPHTLAADGESALFATNYLAVTDGQAAFTNLTGNPLLVEPASAPPASPEAYTDWIQGFFGTDPLRTAREADPDGDGAGNWEEYAALTHPDDASSRFTLRAIRGAGPEMLLTIDATSTNRLYTLYSRARAEGGAWLANDPRRGGGAALQWRVTNSAGGLCYRAGVGF